MKFGSAPRFPCNAKKRKKKAISVQTPALISLSILTLASHQTKRGSCYFGSGRCSMDSAASCGRLSSPSDEALTWEGVMRLILTLISSVLPSQAACKREPCSLRAPFSISSQIVRWWYIPKKESRECGGGEGKVPVLTATLMASIWSFW